MVPEAVPAPGSAGVVAATTTSAVAPQPPPAAAQVAQAAMAVTHGPAGTQIALRLDPAELGRVWVHINQPASGPAEVRITAERVQTADLLRADHPALLNALDQAGVAPQDRTVTIVVADPASNDHAPGSSGDPAAGSPMSGSLAGDGQSNAGGTRSGPDSSDGQSPTPRDSRSRSIASRWRRAGVDITA